MVAFTHRETAQIHVHPTYLYVALGTNPPFFKGELMLPVVRGSPRSFVLMEDCGLPLSDEGLQTFLGSLRVARLGP